MGNRRNNKVQCTKRTWITGPPPYLIRVSTNVTLSQTGCGREHQDQGVGRGRSPVLKTGQALSRSALGSLNLWLRARSTALSGALTSREKSSAKNGKG
jgi:hypothetical protein